MGARKEAMPAKIFPRISVCTLCSESKDSHANLLHPQFLGVFFGSCDRPMPGPFPALPLFSRKKPWERDWLKS